MYTPMWISFDYQLCIYTELPWNTFYSYVGGREWEYLLYLFYNEPLCASYGSFNNKNRKPSILVDVIKHVDLSLV